MTFIKPNVVSADSGIYSVTASNCAGIVTSSDAVVSIADAPYVLVGLTNHAWRYEQSGTDLGTAWRATNYDDALWPQGRGLLALENLAALIPLTNTVLTLSYPGGGQIPTYYFRTHFTVTNDPALVTLLASNYFDDGAVVYLNGVEAFRYNMGNGLVTFNSLAPAANPLGEGVFIVSNLPSGLVLEGDNELAVEVHQNSLVSADIAFGLAVHVNYLAPTLMQITNQPADLVVEETRSGTFTAGVSGLGAHYQWFKDGVAIPGANAPALTFGSAQVSDQGLYTLVASNAINVVTSRVATLVVLRDQSAPVLLAAEMIDPVHVLASFSELLLAGSATNPALYSVTNTFGGVAAISRAVLTNGTNVLLTISPLSANANYVLTTAGLPDTSPQHNAGGFSAVAVARTFPLLSFDSYWEYFDPFPPFENPDPGPDWKEFDYDTSGWGYAAGAFAYSQDAAFAPPVPVWTGLGITPVYAAYFRAGFNVAVSPSGVTLKLRHAVDDAVVFYLNGSELHRFNLPAGAVTAATPAAAALATPSISLPIEVPGETLRAGPNLLAAELHQFTTNATQKFFAAELMARVESLLTGPLLVLGGPADALVIENHPATFRVSSVAASTFQWQLNGADLPGATNATLSLLAPFALNGAQVRCVCGGAGGPITTTNATLHVLPDLTRPALLSAVMNSNGAIVLSFSKSLADGPAMNLVNYLVTNNAGVAVPLIGATLVNGTNVVLTLGGLLSGGYTVVVSGLTDTAGQPNSIVPGSAARVSADYFIPFDSAWKYLLINTNAAVQAAFMQVNYDDSAWSGPSNALLYVEDASLPGPKNTPLSFFDSSGTNRINTYYFRKNFFVPLGTTNLTMKVRHIIDDGMVLHLNGVEIYRYNMSVGAVTAASQATSAIEAALLGPFNVSFTNLMAGTNVFAVEVHQYGVASVDVVMGVEMSLQIPGGVLPLANLDPQARLGLQAVGQHYALVWGEPGFVLEGAAEVGGPWRPVANTSPLLVPATNAAAFYRLRR